MKTRLSQLGIKTRRC